MFLTPQCHDSLSGHIAETVVLLMLLQPNHGRTRQHEVTAKAYWSCSCCFAGTRGNSSSAIIGNLQMYDGTICSIQSAFRFNSVKLEHHGWTLSLDAGIECCD